MNLQDSPSLDDFSDGYQPPPDPEARRKRIRLILLILSLFVFILGFSNFYQSDVAAYLAQKGSISGFAVDESGRPIQVEIIIFGTNIIGLSDENGYFNIRNVPAGEHSVIVAYGSIAAEVGTIVHANGESNVGTITVPTELAKFVDE